MNMYNLKRCISFFLPVFGFNSLFMTYSVKMSSVYRLTFTRFDNLLLSLRTLKSQGAFTYEIIDSMTGITK